MERMKDLTQQYVEQLENMVKDLREKNEKQYKTIESLYENVKYFDHRLCDIDSKLISKQEENKKLKEENKKLKEENEQLKDRFMLRLAEAYLLPPKSSQMAEVKKRDFSKWYKEIKNQMRKEILEGK